MNHIELPQVTFGHRSPAVTPPPPNSPHGTMSHPRVTLSTPPNYLPMDASELHIFI